MNHIIVECRKLLQFIKFKRKEKIMKNTNNYATKVYTLASLIKEVSSAKVTTATATDLIATLSPRLGTGSVKVEVLNDFLNNKFFTVVNGRGTIPRFGKTAKARLLKALRLRKNNGEF